MDLSLDGYDAFAIDADGNAVVSAGARFHGPVVWTDLWVGMDPPLAASAAVDHLTDTTATDTVAFEAQSLQTGAWTFWLGDEYGEPHGWYDLSVRVTAPDVPHTWFVDADADGWGDPDDTIDAPVAPDGVAWRADDCDDGDAGVHPLAWDMCEDGRDEDCTGTDKPCHGPPGDGGSVEQYAGLKAYVEHAPYDLAPVGDADGDGVPEVWARDGSSVAVIPAAPGPRLTGPLDASAPGWGRSAAGDFDHDGVPDVVWGIADEDVPGLVHLTATPTDPASIVAGAWATLVGPGPDSDAGRGVVVGDVDGDGWNDLVVESGRDAWLLTAVTPGTHALPVVAEATLGTLWGGEVIPPIDLDGDGSADLAIVRDEDAWLIHGPISGALTELDADATVTLDDALLHYAHDAGDTDGDGRAELMVMSGVVGLFEDPTGPVDQAGATVLATASTSLGSATLADVDRDGFDELLVGYSTPAGSWEVDLAYGPLPAALAFPDDADAVFPTGEGDIVGQELRSADYDADGTEDVAIRTYDPDWPDPWDPGHGYAFWLL
jgi:hypothetical protein